MVVVAVAVLVAGLAVILVVTVTMSVIVVVTVGVVAMHEQAEERRVDAMVARNQRIAGLEEPRTEATGIRAGSVLLIFTVAASLSCSPS
jgi:hypothetical protein